MADYRYDFGLATAIAAEAIGQPGNRTFRLLIRNETASAWLWVEKEQLQALALAGHELMAQLGVAEVQGGAEANSVSPFSPNADVVLKVGQLAIGYDPAGSLFMLMVYEIDADLEGQGTLRCFLTGPQLAALARQAQEVCAAGRPRCVLCGSPLEPAPHLCPPSNGHGTLPGH